MYCGWLGKDLWPKEPQQPLLVGQVQYDAPMCPGWVVRQPAVVEAAQAYSARKDGCLGDYFPEPSNALLEAVDVTAMSFNSYESAKLKEHK